MNIYLEIPLRCQKEEKGNETKAAPRIDKRLLSRPYNWPSLFSIFVCTCIFIVLWWFGVCARARVKIIRPNPRRRAIDKFLSRGTRRGFSDYRLSNSHTPVSLPVSPPQKAFIKTTRCILPIGARAAFLTMDCPRVNNLANWDTWTSVLTERVCVFDWLLWEWAVQCASAIGCIISLEQLPNALFSCMDYL